MLGRALKRWESKEPPSNFLSCFLDLPSVFLWMEKLTSALSLQEIVEAQSELLYMTPGVPGEVFRPQPGPLSIHHSAHITAGAKTMSTCVRWNSKGILCFNLPHSSLIILTQWLVSVASHHRLPPDLNKKEPSLRCETCGHLSQLLQRRCCHRNPRSVCTSEDNPYKWHNFHVATKWSQFFSRFVWQ